MMAVPARADSVTAADAGHAEGAADRTELSLVEVRHGWC